MVKDVDGYINEWVDYNLALGFCQIFVYVNEEYPDQLRNTLSSSVSSSSSLSSDDNPTNTSSWYDNRYAGRVQVIHFPGEAQQLHAFRHCAERLQRPYNDNHEQPQQEDIGRTHPAERRRRHTWVAFFDSDEYLVLRSKKYTNVVPFLHDYLPNGSLSVNWVMFGSSAMETQQQRGGNSTIQNKSSIGHHGEDTTRTLVDEYSTTPLLKRCQYRENMPAYETKTIARIVDLNVTNPISHPHYVNLKIGTVPQRVTGTVPQRRDTDGRIIVGDLHANQHKPSDVAVIHHYGYKSRKEYIQKRIRGRPVVTRNDKSNTALIQQARSGSYLDMASFNVYDPSAWEFLTKHVPKYQYFDQKT
jgi:Glycosyl transferase family 2